MFPILCRCWLFLCNEEQIRNAAGLIRAFKNANRAQMPCLCFFSKQVAAPLSNFKAVCRGHHWPLTHKGNIKSFSTKQTFFFRDYSRVKEKVLNFYKCIEWKHCWSFPARSPCYVPKQVCSRIFSFLFLTCLIF